METSENHTHPNVLIVEDELDICYLLKMILIKKNIRSTCVTTLRDAQKFLSGQIPDILFLDNHLPDGYGIDFISFIKKNYPLTKVIMITAHDTNDDRVAALNNGVDYFISKPFTREIIFKTLTTLQEQY